MYGILNIIMIKLAYCVQFISIILNVLNGKLSKKCVTKWTSEVGKGYIQDFIHRTFNIIRMSILVGLWKRNFLHRTPYYLGSIIYTCTSLSPKSNRHKNTFWRIANGKDITMRQTGCRTQTKCIKAVWVQEIESGCLLQNCVVAMLLIPHHQHCITHTAPANPNYLIVLINAVTTKVNG
jgi:hypothetical protein